MLATVSLDKTKFEQVLLIHSTSAPPMATEDLGIRPCVMCMTLLQSARSKGLIHR